MTDLSYFLKPRVDAISKLWEIVCTEAKMPYFKVNTVERWTFPVSWHTKKGPYVFQFVVLQMFMPSSLFGLQFVCVEVLRPSQPNGIMSSVVNLPNHTFTGQA